MRRPRPLQTRYPLHQKLDEGYCGGWAKAEVVLGHDQGAVEMLLEGADTDIGEHGSGFDEVLGRNADSEAGLNHLVGHELIGELEGDDRLDLDSLKDLANFEVELLP